MAIGWQWPQTQPLRHQVSQDTNRARRAMSDCLKADYTHSGTLGDTSQPILGITSRHGRKARGKGILRDQREKDHVSSSGASQCHWHPFWPVQRPTLHMTPAPEC